MYCSSCGTALVPGLSYCNRCGTELKPKQSGPMKLSETAPEYLVGAITAVTIVGLGIVIGMMAVMKQVLHFDNMLIIAFSLLTFLTFIGVDSVFIWVLLRSKWSAKGAPGIAQDKGFTRRELDEAKRPALSEAAPSVTENTTRSLERLSKEQITR
jgi:hypothetical protein